VGGRGTLKAGARHIYAKRRFYLDEDSWIALASDQYDARGQLYRGVFAFLSQSYDKQVPDATPFMIYDLVGGSYNINGVVGPYGGIKYIEALSKAQWSPESLAGCRYPLSQPPVGASLLAMDVNDRVSDARVSGPSRQAFAARVVV
jgi:hypothetical protein